MVFSDSPDDQPGRLAWSVPGVIGSGGDAQAPDASPPWTAIFLLIAALAFGFAFFLGRQHGRPNRSIR
jgi:hypothetical protein